MVSIFKRFTFFACLLGQTAFAASYDSYNNLKDDHGQSLWPMIVSFFDVEELEHFYLISNNRAYELENCNQSQALSLLNYPEDSEISRLDFDQINRLNENYSLADSPKINCLAKSRQDLTESLQSDSMFVDFLYNRDFQNPLSFTNVIHDSKQRYMSVSQRCVGSSQNPLIGKILDLDATSSQRTNLKQTNFSDVSIDEHLAIGCADGTVEHPKFSDGSDIAPQSDGWTIYAVNQFDPDNAISIPEPINTLDCTPPLLQVGTQCFDEALQGLEGYLLASYRFPEDSRVQNKTPFYLPIYTVNGIKTTKMTEATRNPFDRDTRRIIDEQSRLLKFLNINTKKIQELPTSVATSFKIAQARFVDLCTDKLACQQRQRFPALINRPIRVDGRNFLFPDPEYLANENLISEPTFQELAKYAQKTSDIALKPILEPQTGTFQYLLDHEDPIVSKLILPNCSDFDLLEATGLRTAVPRFEPTASSQSGVNYVDLYEAIRTNPKQLSYATHGCLDVKPSQCVVRANNEESLRLALSGNLCQSSEYTELVVQIEDDINMFGSLNLDHSLIPRQVEHLSIESLSQNSKSKLIYTCSADAPCNTPINFIQVGNSEEESTFSLVLRRLNLVTPFYNQDEQSRLTAIKVNHAKHLLLDEVSIGRRAPKNTNIANIIPPARFECSNKNDFGNGLDIQMQRPVFSFNSNIYADITAVTVQDQGDVSLFSSQRSKLEACRIGLRSMNAKLLLAGIDISAQTGILAKNSLIQQPRADAFQSANFRQTAVRIYGLSSELESGEEPKPIIFDNSFLSNAGLFLDNSSYFGMQTDIYGFRQALKVSGNKTDSCFRFLAPTDEGANNAFNPNGVPVCEEIQDL